MVKKLFYSMGEVAEMFDVNASLIRHWESKFDVLRPRKNKKGNRMFSPEDVEHLKLIYHLVKERGMTLEGANRSLKRNKGLYARDAELLERLQRVRAMLLEVREELRTGDGETILDDVPEAAATYNSDKAYVAVGNAADPESDKTGFSGRGVSAGAHGNVPGSDAVARAAVGDLAAVHEARGEEDAAGAEREPSGESYIPPGEPPAPILEPDSAVWEDVSKNGMSVAAAADRVPDVNLPAEEGAASALEPALPAAAAIGITGDGALSSSLPAAAPGTSERPFTGSSEDPDAEPGLQPVVRRPRRKRDDEGDKELFAFYEQSLF